MFLVFSSFCLPWWSLVSSERGKSHAEAFSVVSGLTVRGYSILDDSFSFLVQIVDKGFLAKSLPYLSGFSVVCTLLEPLQLIDDASPHLFF